MPLNIGDRIKVKKNGRLGTIKGVCREPNCYTVTLDVLSPKSVYAYHINFLEKQKPTPTDTGA